MPSALTSPTFDPPHPACAQIPFELTALSRALTEEQAELSRASVDTVGDGVADALLIDTVGDGRMGSLVSLDSMAVAATPASPGNAEAAAAAAAAPVAAAAPAAAAVAVATTRRPLACTACGLVGHEVDAIYCRRCAAALPPPPAA